MQTRSMLTLLVVGMLVSVTSARPGETYTNQYDNIDLDEIIKNERLYKKYFECLKGTGKCSPDGKALKEALPDALEHECSKCTDKQKAGAEKILKYALDNKPADFAVLEKIYDPNGVYRKRYQAEAEKRGYKI